MPPLPSHCQIGDWPRSLHWIVLSAFGPANDYVPPNARYGIKEASGFGNATPLCLSTTKKRHTIRTLLLPKQICY
jgi:hypothetical protein